MELKEPESGNYYFSNPKNTYENFMNEWAKSKLSDDPNCSKNEIMHTGNDEWNKLKQKEAELKMQKKFRLKKIDDNLLKKNGNGMPFLIKDLQGIIQDFVNPNKSLNLEYNDSNLNELLESNTGKMIMVDNFLHMFTMYKKNLKEQRLEILSRSSNHASHLDKKLKLDGHNDDLGFNSAKFGVREAFYSVAAVYEMDVNGVSVIRRKSDNWVNATTILKAAGIGKGRKKRKTLENINGNVQIIQGGYWKLQGTWVPLENARLLARCFDLHDVLSPLLDF